jgi:hypothetical protein
MGLFVKRCPFRWQCLVTTDRNWLLLIFNSSLFILAEGPCTRVHVPVQVHLRKISVSCGPCFQSLPTFLAHPMENLQTGSSPMLGSSDHNLADWPSILLPSLPSIQFNFIQNPFNPDTGCNVQATHISCTLLCLASWMRGCWQLQTSWGDLVVALRFNHSLAGWENIDIFYSCSS